jgi:hypothetical protein
MFVACSAFTDRKLLQQSGLFNCGGTKQLDGKCCQLCWCIGDQSDKKSLAPDAIQKYCREQCQKCADEGKKCAKADSALPEVCSKGLQFSPAVSGLVNKCIAMYQNDPKVLSQAKC